MQRKDRNFFGLEIHHLFIYLPSLLRKLTTHVIILIPNLADRNNSTNLQLNHRRRCLVHEFHCLPINLFPTIFPSMKSYDYLILRTPHYMTNFLSLTVNTYLVIQVFSSFCQELLHWWSFKFTNSLALVCMCTFWTNGTFPPQSSRCAAFTAI